MAYEHPGAGALDYLPCRYGKSRLLFRGPPKRLDRPYDVALGGTETYGKFVAAPFAARTAEATGVPMINLGCVNAGPDTWLNDPVLPEVAARARVRVVQVTGAQNLSNPFYTVHPRRNDRFLRAAPELRRLYPEVDFTDFAFTRHLLFSLRRRGSKRFERVAGALRSTWVARMSELLKRLEGPVILLWMAGRPPPVPGGRALPDRDPLLVDAAMIADLRPLAAAYLEVVTEPPERPAEGMIFAPLERAAAEGLPGPVAHRAVAQALAPMLEALACEA